MNVRDKPFWYYGVKKEISRHRRTRLELYYNILKYCYNIKDKNHNRNQINCDLLISFAQLNEYILTLKDAGLLEINRYDRTFKTTLKGIEFIRKFDFLTQQLKL